MLYGVRISKVSCVSFRVVVALVFVLSGVILYETSPSPVLEDGELILGDNSDEVNTSVLEQEMKHGNNSFDFELPVLKSGLT